MAEDVGNLALRFQPYLWSDLLPLIPQWVLFFFFKLYVCPLQHVAIYLGFYWKFGIFFFLVVYTFSSLPFLAELVNECYYIVKKNQCRTKCI